VWMEDNLGKSEVGRDRGVVLQLGSSDLKEQQLIGVICGRNEC
jgi:hypothetical protein